MRDESTYVYQKSERTIVCFTASYPYGNRETYFETELKFLSNAFEKVIIIPRYNPFKSDGRREVPANVEVLDPIVVQGWRRVLYGLFNRSPVKSFILEFLKKKVFLNHNHFLKWFNALLVHRTTFCKIKPLIRSLDKNTVLYAYWAEIPLFTSDCVRSFKKVVRMHGGDFYLNRNHGYLPLRQDIYDAANLLLPISKDIANVLTTTYNQTSSKILINHLGVQRSIHEIKPYDVTSYNTKVIVSCSNVIPLKRVHLIVDALKLASSEENIEWHHFGDGIELKAIEKRIELLSDNIKVFLHGWTSPNKLMDFYRANNITWFINVSKYEGIPVSIMEAFSFGIPAIATNVGGTSEIVNNENGYLVSPDFEPQKLLDLITGTKVDRYLNMRINAYNTWNNRFNASVNYQRLISKLMILNEQNNIL
uniref:Glycosyl transferase group 1 n=1 Tax=Sphingobacterium sp. (strain 21) TaxID=743722 RepID=F4C960_SPHS2